MSDEGTREGWEGTAAAEAHMANDWAAYKFARSPPRHGPGHLTMPSVVRLPSPGRCVVRRL